MSTSPGGLEELEERYDNEDAWEVSSVGIAEDDSDGAEDLVYQCERYTILAAIYSHDGPGQGCEAEKVARDLKKDWKALKRDWEDRQTCSRKQGTAVNVKEYLTPLQSFGIALASITAEA